MNLLHFSRSQISAEPLERVSIFVAGDDVARLSVCDALGREYFSSRSQGEVSFSVGGALGLHRIRLLREGNEHPLSEVTFTVSARTSIQDAGGVYADLLEMLHRTMCCYSPTGSESIQWKGRTVRYFVPWILDHVHTARGMRYFTDATRELVDLFSEVQREDGMIWSQVEKDGGWPDFFDTRDDRRNFYTRRDGEIRLMRQPVENHCEANFVDCVHLVWKSGGDQAWMQSRVDSAKRALDYTRNSPVRWSAKFGLLKRGYTVDSCDFQIEDEYSVELGVGSDLKIDEQRTKFGIFFGDNTGYARACTQLAEMLVAAGRGAEAEEYRTRGRDIRARLTALSWNGRFYRHRIEEDPAVVRNLGVDEAAQIAMSNAYSLNRDIPPDQSAAILETYRNLRANLPEGSPGEWYAIYPPFGRGFGGHNGKWQYMNGGVHGHAAGELARGAFAHGDEAYGADILGRLRTLGHANGNILHFAYTGAYDAPPPPPVFTPVSLAAVANMNLSGENTFGVFPWLLEAPANNLRSFPTGGVQTFNGVPYDIANPSGNAGKVGLLIGHRPGLSARAEVPIGRLAGAFYLLHTAGASQSHIGGSVTLRYADGTSHALYLVYGQHLSGWWFPTLTAPDAGIAWRGANEMSACVGLSWACLTNPHPGKLVESLTFAAPDVGGLYALVGLTLADRAPYHRPDPVSTGGPDNWSGGTVTAALVEGLAGVQDAEGSVALQDFILSPRWTAAGVDQVKAIIVNPASGGYVGYTFAHQPEAKTITLQITGSGQAGRLRILLPPTARKITSATLDDKPVDLALESVSQSVYACLPLVNPAATRTLTLSYQ